MMPDPLMDRNVSRLWRSTEGVLGKRWTCFEPLFPSAQVGTHRDLLSDTDSAFRRLVQHQLQKEEQ